MGLIILRNYENDYFENNAETVEENNFYDPSIFKQSHLGLSNGFYIGLNENSFYMNNFDKYWQNQDILGFTGIMLENISLDFNTPWTDAGGAQIGKKIAGYANSKFIKILAGQSEKGFQPFICSDAWTQQKVGGDASPLKISLKFRAFQENVYGMSTYDDIIRFLICICSPMKSASYVKTGNTDQYGTEGIGTQAKNNIVNAANGAGEIFANVSSASKGFAGMLKQSADESEGIANRKFFKEAVKDLAKTAQGLYNTIVTNASDGRNNANFTVNFRLGKPNTLASKINQRAIGENNIDWIITSFNFKPSMQFTFDNNSNKPYPLWVDFDLSMETRLALSNRYIHNLITKDEF